MKLHHYLIKPIGGLYPKRFDIPPAIHSSDTSLAAYRSFFRIGTFAQYFPFSREGFFLADENEFLLLSHIFSSENVDTASRSGIVNHVSIIPREALLKGKFRLGDVISAMKEFEEKYGDEEGKVEKLDVPEVIDPASIEIPSLVHLLELNATLFVANSLLGREREKIVIRTPSVDESLTVALALIELLNIRLKIKDILTFSTSMPKQRFVDAFKLYVLDHPKRVEGDGWYSMQKSVPKSVERIEEYKEIYDAVVEYYRRELNKDLGI